MARLTKTQMAMYAAAAGLPNPMLWGAIGMAESSGRTDVVNSIGCVGLWQINQPVHVRNHPKWTVAWLKNPLNNARAAKVIYESSGYGAWEAYTSGAYKQYYNKNAVLPAGWMDDFKDGFKDGWDFGPGLEDLWDGDGLSDDWDLNPPDTGLGEVAGGLSDIAGFMAKAGNWISNAQNWVRIGYVVGGGLLVLVGVQMVIRGQAVSTASKALGGTAGRAVKRAKKGGTA